MPFAKKAGASPIYRTAKYRNDRAALIAAFQPGDPCCLCGHPMTTSAWLEAQHEPGTERLVGLCHGTRNRCSTCGKRCNQVDGARRGRARQSTKATRLRW